MTLPVYFYTQISKVVYPTIMIVTTKDRVYPLSFTFTGPTAISTKRPIFD